MAENFGSFNNRLVCNSQLVCIFTIAILSNTTNVISVKLYHGTAPWPLPIYTTFSDLDYISRSHHCQTVLTENLMFLFAFFKIQLDQKYASVSFIFAHVERR